MRQATASLGSLVEGDAPDCRLMHHHPTDRETQMGRQSMDHHHHQDNWDRHPSSSPADRPSNNPMHHTYLLVYSSDVCVRGSVCARTLHLFGEEVALPAGNRHSAQHGPRSRCQIQPPTGQGDTRGRLP